MRLTTMMWLPGALMIVVIPVALALAGQSLHPWRLTWIIPLGLALYGGLIKLLAGLKP